MAILYGIKKVVLTELDPATEKPKLESAKTATITTAEECEMEALLAEGAEDVLRTDNEILAIVDVDELPYGYNLTFKDNTLDAEALSIITSMTSAAPTNSENKTDKKLTMPMMADGNSKQMIFKMELYVANYKGSSIVDYCKITFNKCKGKPINMTIGKEFYAPELEIKAREATKGGAPMLEIDFVDQLPS